MTALKEHEGAFSDKEWWSAEDLQGWLGIGRTKSYEILNQMSTYSIDGRLKRVHRDDLKAWLEQQRRGPGE